MGVQMDKNIFFCALLTLSCRATTTQPPNLMNWNMTGMIQTLTASGGLSYTAGN